MVFHDLYTYWSPTTGGRLNVMKLEYLFELNSPGAVVYIVILRTSYLVWFHLEDQQCKVMRLVVAPFPMCMIWSFYIWGGYLFIIHIIVSLLLQPSMKWKTYNFNEEFYAIFAIFTLFIARQKFSIPGTKNFYLGLNDASAKAISAY